MGLIIDAHYPFACVRAVTAFAGNCGVLLSRTLISAETDTGVSTSTTFMVPVQLTDIAENFPSDTVRLIVP